MTRMIGLTLFVLATLACGSSTAPSPTIQGGWSGQIAGFPTNIIGGLCLAQSCAAMSFWVNQNNTVTCFVQGVGTPRGSGGFNGCNVDSPFSGPGSGDPIQNNSFQINPGFSTYKATGVFDTATSAHGTLNVPVGPNGQGTGGTQYNWTANKES